MLRVFKALADETRLRLIGILAQGDFNVNELIDILQMGQSRVSRHLKILSESGLVRPRREGNWVYYALVEHNGSRDAVSLGLQGARQLPQYGKDVSRVEAAILRRRRRSQSFFDQIGPDWEQLQKDLVDTAAYRQHALALLPAQLDCSVDLGVGGGRLLPALLQRSARIVAVDTSQTMLRAAAAHVSQMLPERVDDCDFRLGELEHLPLADHSVDAAVALMVFHHVSSPQRAIQEVQRILRPGGVLVIADLLEHQRLEMRDQHADLWLGFDAVELSAWLTTAGFTVGRRDVIDAGGALRYLIVQARTDSSTPEKTTYSKRKGSGVTQGSGA